VLFHFFFFICVNRSIFFLKKVLITKINHNLMEQYMWKTPIIESGSVRDSDELPESERRTN
jgi:hypothetical protein